MHAIHLSTDAPAVVYYCDQTSLLQVYTGRAVVVALPPALAAPSSTQQHP